LIGYESITVTGKKLKAYGHISLHQYSATGCWKPETVARSCSERFYKLL